MKKNKLNYFSLITKSTSEANMKNGDLPAMPTSIDPQTLTCTGRMATVEQLYQQSAGCTKREQFAMAAMQGILSNGVDFTMHEDKDVAKAAIIHADNLLAELERAK